MRNKITRGQSLSVIETNIAQELKGKKLWGDLETTAEEYEILRDLLRDFLRVEGASIYYLCKTYPNCLITYMIALVKYKFNYNFWGLLAEELSISVYGPVESAIGKCAKEAFDRFGFDYSDVKGEKRVNLEPIFYEAGLPPESSLNDLFYILNYDSHAIFDPQLIVDDLIHMRSYQIRKPMLKFLKRFKEDRAVEFILEVHEAMLSVDQRRSGDSQYVDNYTEWKSTERSRESINNRKKQEYQTRPYLSFENGKRGLCIVLPRTILKDEWIEDVEWQIRNGEGYETSRKVEVFGDNGQRFVDSLVVAVPPSSGYTIELLDRESLDNQQLLIWRIDGIPEDKCVFFNNNGRLINPSYLPLPYGIMICGRKTEIQKSEGITTNLQVYPNGNEAYRILSIEPKDLQRAELHYLQEGKSCSLFCRPQTEILFEGETLFHLPINDEYHLFTEIPLAVIRTDPDAILSGLELRVGNERINIEAYFQEGTAEIPLAAFFIEKGNLFGTYSVRLYQNDHFIRQAEFSLLPNIESNYNPELSWPKSLTDTHRRRFVFRKVPHWHLEFEGCIVNNDRDSYIAHFPANIGYIPLRITSGNEESKLVYTVNLPVNPVEYSFLDNEGQSIDEGGKRTIKMGLTQMFEKEHWLHLNSYGEYRDKTFQLLVRSVNGVEQVRQIPMSQNHCGNISINNFYDTLQNCPLPCRLELMCEEDQEHAIPVLAITDSVPLKRRPLYNAAKDVLCIEPPLDNVDLTLYRFGTTRAEYHSTYEDSKTGTITKNNIPRKIQVYNCDQKILPGIYYVESLKKQNEYEFEDDSDIAISHGTDTIFINDRSSGLPIESIRDWLIQLIRDILKSGITKDLTDSASFVLVNQLPELKRIELNAEDYEMILSLACFVHAKCSNDKREMILKCMHRISEHVLNANSRLEIIRTLDEMNCSREIFDICLQHYNLYLFEPGSADAKELSGRIEDHSLALSMLLKMSAEDTIRNALWRDKFIDILGRDAIRSMLTVPGTTDPAAIVEEQKKFIKEKKNNGVRIHLAADISGEMEPIQGMISYSFRNPFLDLSKKPDTGLYFDHIRYVDQYINWYTLNHDSKTQVMFQKTKDRMVFTVQKYCADLMKHKTRLQRMPEAGQIIPDYDEALMSRYDKDPTSNLNTCIPARYFYLQGIAALLSQLPVSNPEYRDAIRTGEKFMVNAISISPRIARRDLIMATTYIFLKRKEIELCQ